MLSLRGMLLLSACSLPVAFAVVPDRGAQELPAGIGPFLKQHCFRCHGAEKPKGNLRLDTLRGAITPEGGETAIWENILKRLQSRDMPPKGQPTPDAEQHDAAVHWVRTALRKIGKDDATELAYPNKGNYLDHRLLFGTPSKAFPATPARVWRTSPFQYSDLVERFKPRGSYDPGLPNPFGLTSDHGFRDYAFRYTVGPAETQQMMLNGRTVVAHLIRSDPRKIPLAGLAKLKQAPTDEQMQAAVTWLFEAVLCRTPDADEAKRYGGLLSKAIQRFGNEQGVVQGLAPVFLHPEVVFRSELGAGPSDEHGRVMLAPRELAFALALALTDRQPDAQLLKAARAGELTTREAARREVERLLNDPEIAKPRILRFFQEYFGYDRAPTVFKDKHIPYVPLPGADLVEDTDQLVLYLLKKDQHVLRELLTTNLSFVHVKNIKRVQDSKGKGPRGDEHYIRHYNLTLDQWRTEQPLTLPDAFRAGILTQPSWLYAFSNNVEGQPIHRGKWVYEHLLGGTVPDTPITVDAKLPDEAHNTLRERMRFTREPYCWACHQRMNPLGLTFEMFDGFGRFRTEEIVTVRQGEGKTAKTIQTGVKVDTSGELPESGDPTLTGPITNAVELVHRLAKSDHVHQVFVRHAFRYWMGRNETLDDAPTLQAAYKAYKDNNGSMKALLTSLLTSDSFLYRRLPATP